MSDWSLDLAWLEARDAHRKASNVPLHAECDRIARKWVTTMLDDNPMPPDLARTYADAWLVAAATVGPLVRGDAHSVAVGYVIMFAAVRLADAAGT